jgi:hypothetical protein
MMLEARQNADFQHALTALGRSPEIDAEADVYGWLIGSWELDVRYYGVDVTARGMQGEAHFEWVLEGRAVQDTWIMPRLSERAAGLDRTMNMYGTTIRVWDPAIQGWRVTYINPVTGQRDELIGRRRGEDVVQLGTHADGRLIRWIFSDITNDAFRWTGETLEGDGRSWKLEAEFAATRIR